MLQVVVMCNVVALFYGNARKLSKRGGSGGGVTVSSD